MTRIRNVSMVFLAVLFAPACVGTGGNYREAEYHFVPGRSQLPFSEAVRVGNMLYLAGQIGTRSMEGDVSKIDLVPGGIKAETVVGVKNCAPDGVTQAMRSGGLAGGRKNKAPQMRGFA